MSTINGSATTTPADWDAAIAAAPSFAAAQDLMEAALAAGVDFAALLAAQRERAS